VYTIHLKSIPMKWLIIFFAYSGHFNEDHGKIFISDSLVYAFNVKWEIDSTYYIYGRADYVEKACISMHNGPTHALLAVNFNQVMFIIPSVESASMLQREHWYHSICSK
jgi:hypothetical protein